MTRSGRKGEQDNGMYVTEENDQNFKDRDNSSAEEARDPLLSGHLYTDFQVKLLAMASSINRHISRKIGLFKGYAPTSSILTRSSFRRCIGLPLCRRHTSIMTTEAFPVSRREF